MTREPRQETPAVRAREVAEGQRVEGQFLLTESRLLVARNGRAYLTLTLCDETGEIPAKVWENAREVAGTLRPNQVVRVVGQARAYRGVVEIHVEEATPVSQANPEAFLPRSTRGFPEMLQELDAFVESVQHPHLGPLLHDIFSDAALRSRLERTPGAKGLHHVFLGGLLEHTLSVAALVDQVARHYGPLVHRDLLMTGTLVHDIGKVFELSADGAFDYTDEGRLLGHIVQGVTFVDRHVQQMSGFPTDLAVALEHLIVSHHGEYEFGSPRRPKTLEAVILHSLEDMDAKVQSFSAHIAADAENDGSFTPFHRIHERFIYKKRLT